MANADAAFGFIPVKNLDGTPFNGATVPMVKAAGNSEVIFIGSPVVLEGGAVLVEERGMTLPTIALATVATTNPVFGVVTSFEAKHGDLTVKHGEASIERIANVALAGHGTVFKCQSDDTTALAAVGEQGSFTGVSGSTTTGYSDAEYDEATGGTGVDQFTVIGYYNTPDNDPSIANSILLVTIAHPQIGSSQVTAGV